MCRFFPMMLRAYDAALLVIFLCIPVVWIQGHIDFACGEGRVGVHWGLRPLLGLLTILAFRILLGSICSRRCGDGSGLWKRTPFPQLIMSLFSIYAFFGAFEVILALKGYTANLPPVVFQGKDNAGGMIIEDTLPDPELLWKFKPGGFFHGRRINSLGFREREVNPAKASETRRVICMGDSVTAQGKPGYSQYLHDLLQTQPPTPGSWEAFNVGVHGYCILQGLRQFEQLDPVLNPDVVTVYFGWNDHWLDYAPVSQRMAVRMGDSTGRIYEMLRRKRFFMFLAARLNPVRALKHSESRERVYRVPPEEYRWALESLIDRIRASDAVPVIITAARGKLTEELFRKSYVRKVEEGERVHDEYVDITRDVARTKNAPLLDLAKILEGPENAALFAEDGIHFDFYSKEGRMTDDPPSQPGLERVAAEIHQYLLQLCHDGTIR